MRNEPEVLTAYAPAQLARIMTVLERAAGGRTLDSAVVEQSLLELVHGVELASDGSEDSRLWHEFSSEEQSPRAERDGFLRLATAVDPFALARRSRRLSALLRLNGALHRHGSRWRRTGFSLSLIRDRNWSALSAPEQDAFRAAMEDAAVHAERFVRQGRETKTRLDAALLGLADLYLSWTGKQFAGHRVPYSVNSQFIRLAAAALEPVGRYFEVSYPALSRRWERIVREARKQERDLDQALPDEDSEQES
jgi:hypothetical protein